MSGGVGQTVRWRVAPRGSRGWAQVCRATGSPTWAPGPFTKESQSVMVSTELGVGCGRQTALAASWPAAHSHWVLPLCLDCRAACAGGPLGPGYLYSLPILQTQAWTLPAPMPVGISLLTTVSSSGVQGVYPHDWAPSQPRRTAASDYPRCRLIPSTSAGGGAGLCSGFVAKCFLFPLSKIFIYAQCSRGAG